MMVEFGIAERRERVLGRNGVVQVHAGTRLRRMIFPVIRWLMRGQSMRTHVAVMVSMFLLAVACGVASAWQR